MKRAIFYFLIVPVIFLFACNGGKQDENNDDADTTKTEEVSEAPAKLFEFPETELQLTKEQIVFAPSDMVLDKARVEGVDKTTFDYGERTVMEPGSAESEIKSISTVYTVPNYMIIPVKEGETAQKGDIVLTGHEKGGSMQRAIVMDDTDPAQPVVRYIDCSLDNPAKIDEKPWAEFEAQAEANSFNKLTDIWQPGTAVAMKNGNTYAHARIIRLKDDKVLTLGFANRMQVHPKSQCTPVPVIPDVAEGDEVFAPFAGTFSKGVVKKIDKNIGRVFIAFDVNPEEEVGIAFGDVIKNLE